jgi:hypothetical protein
LGRSSSHRLLLGYLRSLIRCIGCRSPSNFLHFRSTLCAPLNFRFRRFSFLLASYFFLAYPSFSFRIRYVPLWVRFIIAPLISIVDVSFAFRSICSSRIIKGVRLGCLFGQFLHQHFDVWVRLRLVCGVIVAYPFDFVLRNAICNWLRWYLWRLYQGWLQRCKSRWIANC